MLGGTLDLPAVALFTEYVRRFIDGEQALAEAVTTPVLVWEAGVFAEDWSHPPSQVPTADNPVVFLLRKTEARPNPFEAGISLGRASVNDVVLPHKSISRFHAYFQRESTSARWAVADAASRNGTQADGLPLKPNVPTLLSSAHRLRVGDLDLTFLSSEAFVRWLKKVVETV